MDGADIHTGEGLLRFGGTGHWNQTTSVLGHFHLGYLWFPSFNSPQIDDTVRQVDFIRFLYSVHPPCSLDARPALLHQVRTVATYIWFDFNTFLDSSSPPYQTTKFLFRPNGTFPGLSYRCQVLMKATLASTLYYGGSQLKWLVSVMTVISSPSGTIITFASGIPWFSFLKFETALKIPTANIHFIMQQYHIDIVLVRCGHGRCYQNHADVI